VPDVNVARPHPALLLDAALAVVLPALEAGVPGGEERRGEGMVVCGGGG